MSKHREPIFGGIPIGGGFVTEHNFWVNTKVGWKYTGLPPKRRGNTYRDEGMGSWYLGRADYVVAWWSNAGWYRLVATDERHQTVVKIA